MSDQDFVISEDLNRIASCGLDWSSLANSTVLVTGGGGLLGAYLVRALLRINAIFSLNIRTICLSRSLGSIEYRLFDVLTDPQLDVILHDVTLPLPDNVPSSDYVIHAASQASPKYYSVDPVGTLAANALGTANLLGYCQRCQSKRFLFFSSGEVYGMTSNSDGPISEVDYGYLDPMNVRSCYAESKRIGETMCASWSHQFGLHASVVRPFHTYGPGIALDDGRVFSDFVSDVVNKRDITLRSDGLATRSFCYVADATIGFLTVLLRGSAREAYNVANPACEISMRELALTLASLFPDLGIEVKFESLSSNSSYLRSPNTHALPSISKIKELGWDPTTGLREGFSRTIQSFIGLNS